MPTLTAASKSTIHCMPASTVDPLKRACAVGISVTADHLSRFATLDHGAAGMPGNGPLVGKQNRPPRFHGLSGSPGLKRGHRAGVSSGVGVAGRAERFVGAVWRTIHAARGRDTEPPAPATPSDPTVGGGRRSRAPDDTQYACASLTLAVGQFRVVSVDGNRSGRFEPAAASCRPSRQNASRYAPEAAGAASGHPGRA